MIKILSFAILGIIILSIQSTFFALSFIQRVRPDLLMIFNLYLGLFYPPISGGILTFFLGFITDLFSGNYYGFFSLTRPLIFFIAQFFRNHFYFEDIAYKFIYVFFFNIFEGLLIIFLINLFYSNSESLYLIFFKFLLPQSFSTAILAPIFFKIFNKLNQLFINQKALKIRDRSLP